MSLHSSGRIFLFVILALLNVCCALSDDTTITMWLFETQIKVNPENFAGQFSTNQYSSLMVEFRLVGNVTFDLQG